MLFRSVKVKAVIVDPSAASFIAQLKRSGFHVKKAKNGVLDGIRLMGTLLNQMKILFYKDCVHTIQEFGSYVWDKKAAEQGEDKPVKQADHCLDAARYLCMTVIKMKQSLSILK